MKAICGMFALFYWLKSPCTKIIIFERPFKGLISVFKKNDERTDRSQEKKGVTA